jgi:hypothetical protein
MEGRKEWVIGNEYRISFGSDKNVLKLNEWLHNSVNILRNLLYTLNWWTVYEQYLNKSLWAGLHKVTKTIENDTVHHNSYIQKDSVL